MLIDGIFAKTPVTNNEIPRSQLDITHRTRTNPLPWNGQFSPQLVEVLIKSRVLEGATVLDPFVGSGTVLLEAARARTNSIGVEINPAAYYLARTYETVNFPKQHRKAALYEIDTAISKWPNSAGSLFSIPDVEPSQDALRETLLATRASMHNLAAIIWDALIVLADLDSQRCSFQRTIKAWTKLRALVKSLPYLEGAVSVTQGDARSLPVEAKSIDAVITSPPYINVFNYHQNYRKSVEALGWDVLNIARSEIGANRKHRGNRLLTVVQYCLDISEVLHELSRVVRSGAEAIFIVGRESNVRGIAFYNGELLAELGHRTGVFNLEFRQERVFKNRFGQSIYEDILHFSPGQNVRSREEVLIVARDIAREALIGTEKVVPPGSMEDWQEAIERVDVIESSPCHYHPTVAKGAINAVA